MKYSILLLSIFLFGSCATTTTLDFVKLNKGNILYKTVEDKKAIKNREHDIIIYESKKGAIVKLELDENKLVLKPSSLKSDFKVLDTIKTKTDLVNDTSGKLKLFDAYTYQNKFSANKTKLGLTGLIDDLALNDRISDELKELSLKPLLNQIETEKDNEFKKSVPIIYSDNKMVFQTLTIPFKIRGKKGEMPSTVATNFNAGIAYGYQWNLSKVWPIYGKNGSMVGYEKNKITFSLAPFAGLTTVGLTPENTAPDILVNQTVMGYSIGTAGVFSFNKLNLGLAFGLDHGFGNAENWIYQDKLWTGIVIGLDLIK
ncbi:hypothetical protein [Maribacter sp. Hel_I_7]|uniref:hypothetical protein n=1 Tax=Maribacter sp. Hel_I_7 TaxID=1249997 RepID=UPI00047E4C0D|nr:hypothetical protein [Maribacter sp. Hel_I_7]